MTIYSSCVFHILDSLNTIITHRAHVHILTMTIYNELVHASGTQCGAHSINNSLAGIDIANDLRLSLTRVSAILQQQNRCGLTWKKSE